MSWDKADTQGISENTDMVKACKFPPSSYAALTSYLPLSLWHILYFALSLFPASLAALCLQRTWRPGGRCTSLRSRPRCHPHVVCWIIIAAAVGPTVTSAEPERKLKKRNVNRSRHQAGAREQDRSIFSLLFVNISQALKALYQSSWHVLAQSV